MTEALISTDLGGVERIARGKVRDVYRVGEELLIVATDRISAFDCILPQGIPAKGRVLTQMSLFWFWLSVLLMSTATDLPSGAMDTLP